MIRSKAPLNYYNYYTEIEETFVRRRGKSLFLSPIDWAMIEGWQERGIPLHIVLRAIESVFDVFDKNPGKRAIKGLFYCREEVEAQYAEWSAMQAGKSDGGAEPASDHGFTLEAVSDHILAAISIMKDLKDPNLHEDIERACSRLEELNNNLSENFEIVDRSLSDIENFLDQALLTKSDPVHLSKQEREISAQLKGYKSAMDKDVYKNTFDLMLLKRLREDAGIPRLSLFYL